jgi:hypothetical protein
MSVCEFKFGDVCRAKCTAPARYFGYGLCLYISSSCNDLCIDAAEQTFSDEETLPLPTDRELESCERGYFYALHLTLKGRMVTSVDGDEK